MGVVSAPLNEIRGFLLQSGSKKLSFKEFFKPANFIRSTSLGALNMGISVATGYYLTPIVARLVSAARVALDGGELWAFAGMIISFDVVAFLVARGFSFNVFTRRIDENKDLNTKNTEDIEDLKKKMADLEAANASLLAKVSSIGSPESEK